MNLFANIAVAIVAFIHIYFFVLEMFLWDKPLGLRTFGLTKEFAAASKVLAANQGLYNGFLAVGLLWGLYNGEVRTQIFFLGCIMVAGIFGAITANRRILWVQATPALISLVLICFAK